MAKVGISQGNPLAALGNILRKGPGRGSGRDSRSPRREPAISKKPSFKGSKESLREGNKDSMDSPGRTSEPKSPKMFRFGIRRSSSRSRKGERDDSASDTSSVSSLVLPVKEGPMEGESSNLIVSISADGNEGKENKKGAAEKTASMSANDLSKSGNRNSTYFKPPEVEPLTDLFASGELDALLKTSDNIEKVEPFEPVNVKEEEPERADMEDQASSESGLKRSNLRSSFRMYENRYKAETLERKKEKSPLSTAVCVAGAQVESTKSPISNEENITVSASDRENKLVEDSVLRRRASPEAESSNTNEDKRKQGKYDEKKRRKLFDDELFTSDIPMRSHTRVRVPSATTPSLDAYAKAHQAPPVSIVSEEKRSISSKDGDERVQPVLSFEGVLEAAVARSKEKESCDVSTEEASPGDKTNTETSPGGISGEQLPSTTHSDTGDVDGVGTLYHVAIKEPRVPRSGDETVLEATEVQKESEENECTKDASIVVEKQSTHEETLDEEKKTESLMLCPKSVHTEKKQSSNSPTQKQREGKQLSSQPARSSDARFRIQSGKVSNAKSKFDSSSPSASPRARASTESPRLTTERNSDHDSKAPSWMSDLQKRREQRTKGKELATTGKASIGNGDEDIPDWRKRVLERRRKATEPGSKPSSVGKKADRISKSEKYRETDRVSSRAEKSPRREVSSVARKSPSPSGSKKLSSRAAKSIAGKGEVPAEEKVKVVDKLEGPCKSGVVENISKDHESDTHPKTEVTSSISEVTSSPKPKITSPKPKIEIATKKVAKRSNSSEPVEPTTLSIDIKLTTAATTDENSEEIKCSNSNKPVEPTTLSIDIKPTTATTTDENSAETRRNSVDDEAFVPGTKEESTLLPTTSESPSNLQEHVQTESHQATPSRRSSNSSEKDVGVPFRSRGVSHSRSPTPTTLSPGPLKLPADPGVPDWKKKVLECKKDVAVTKKLQKVLKTEPEIPAWKKELLSKRAKVGEEVSCLLFVHNYNSLVMGVYERLSASTDYRLCIL